MLFLFYRKISVRGGGNKLMFFDFLIKVRMPNNKTQEFGAWKELHSICCAVESNARMDPDSCIINIRQALEVLFSGLCLDAGFTDLPDSWSGIMGKSKGIRGLWYGECNINSFYQLKNQANEIVHISKEVSGIRKYEIKGKHADVTMACKLTMLFYKSVASLFKIDKKRMKPMEADMLPFGEYEVIKKIPKKPYESIEGNFKYIARKNNNNISTYVYVRPFLNTDEKTAFSDRDMEAQQFFKNMRGSNNIIAGEELRTSAYCNLKYLVYNIRENTKTLDEIAKEIKPYELLDIIEQVANGLSRLASSKINIHHRDIRPTCIFVSSFEDGYEAKIGCFETAKIDYKEKSMETVGAWVAQRQKDNVYTHPRMLLESEHDNKEWEAGDVYSLVMVLLACLDTSIEKGGAVDCSVLYDYYSDDFVDEIEGIVRAASLSQIPSMREFDRILLEEMDNE